MAKFDVEFDNNTLSFIDKVGNMTDDRVVNAVLLAGAEVIVNEWKKSGISAGYGSKGSTGRGTGELLNSIAPSKPRKMDGVRSVDIYPQGVHHIGSITGRKNRNAEIAFVLNYGRGYPKIEASNWAMDAVEDATSKAMDAMQAAFDAETSKIGG